MKKPSVEVPLVWGFYKEPFREAKASVDEDLFVHVLRFSQYWYVDPRKRPGMDTPRVSIGGLVDENDKPYQLTVLLNRLCYLFSRLPEVQRHELSLRSNLSELWEQLRKLPRIKHYDKDKLNCVEENMYASTKEKVRRARQQKLGFSEDIQDSDEELREQEIKQVRTSIQIMLDKGEQVPREYLEFVGFKTLEEFTVSQQALGIETKKPLEAMDILDKLRRSTENKSEEAGD